MKDFSLVIGGANVDIQGFPENQLKLRDSNPGKLKISLGGVGRNIADNMCRLGLPTKLVTALGEDVYAAKIREGAKKIGLDLSEALTVPEQSSSTYLSILDENGDMALALADMDIIDKLDMNFIRQKTDSIKAAKIVVVDTNLHRDLLDQLTFEFPKTSFLLDTVSTTKAIKVKDFVGRFHTIKPNKAEAEILSGIKIESNEDLSRVEEYFMKQGVKRLFITLNKEGVFFSDGINRGKINCIQADVINSTGAGDAFVAALAYCHVNEMVLQETAYFAQCAAVLALSHEDTINPNMSVENILKMYN
ncbi:MAG: kinase, PfkB family [Bacillales bacterium]|jgi:pseudouridine kinase|nr:kinase, PfkB family [Bacillales bacterium]